MEQQGLINFLLLSDKRLDEYLAPLGSQWAILGQVGLSQMWQFKKSRLFFFILIGWKKLSFVQIWTKLGSHQSYLYGNSPNKLELIPYI